MEEAQRRISVLGDQLAPCFPDRSFQNDLGSLRAQQCRAFEPNARSQKLTGPPIIIGGMLLDVQAKPSDGLVLLRGGSVPGTIQQRPGGVARNIGECLARLCRLDSLERAGLLPLLISVVGEDAAGGLLLSQWQQLGLSTEAIHVLPGLRTPSVSIIFDSGGEVAASIADVALPEVQLPKLLKLHRQDIQRALLLILDGNMPQQSILEAASMAAAAGVPVWFEPVSVPKSVRAAAALHLLQYISPNAAELTAISEAVCLKDDSQPSRRTHSTEHGESNTRQGTAGERKVMELKHHIKRVLDAGVGNIVLTLGADGAALCTLSASGGGISVAHMPTAPAQLVTTSGAGDCLVAGCCWGLLKGRGPVEALAHGMTVAHAAVETHLNVPEGLTQRGLSERAAKTQAACCRWTIAF